jgi:hypothetical protein
MALRGNVGKYDFHWIFNVTNMMGATNGHWYVGMKTDHQHSK